MRDKPTHYKDKIMKVQELAIAEKVKQEKMALSLGDEFEFLLEDCAVVGLQSYFSTNLGLSKSISVTPNKSKTNLSTKSNFTLSEEFIQILRNFYKVVNNQFIKKVVVEVGKSRKMSERQLEMICEEMAKYNEFEF